MHHFHPKRLRALTSLLTTLFTATLSLGALFSILGPGNPLRLPAVQPAQAASPRVLYVKPNAIGGNCLTWGSACNLSSALSQPIAPDGNEIWVAKGVYRLEDNIQLRNKVALYGGFAGSESTREQRNFTANVTVLSGDIDGDDLTDANGVVTTSVHISGTNLSSIISSSNVTGTAVLDGFTITAANNRFGDGGGLYNYNNSHPTLANLVFSGNAADNEGGGMYNGYQSHPSLTNVTFRGNSAGDSGGGLSNYYNSNPSLTNVTFSDNTASSRGGGMYNYSGANATLTNVTFTNNQAPSGGGMQNQNSDPTLNQVTFAGNAADNNGGGLYNSNGKPTLNQVTFNGNSATSYGGGLYNYNSNSSYVLVLHASTFSNNWSDSGGGMYNDGLATVSDTTFHKNSASNGGAIYIQSSSPTLTGVTFNDNSATGHGGAVYNYGGSPVFINIQFSENAANSYGGGIYSQSGALKLTNAIFSGNSASNGGGVFNQNSGPALTNVSLYGNIALHGSGIYNQSSSNVTLANAILWGNQTGGEPPIYNNGSTPTISYSLIQGGCPAGSNCDSHVLDADPLFVDAANGNLRLQKNSPAIDSGDNDASGLFDISTDLDGKARFTNDLTIPDTGNGTPPIVDLGAYEFEPQLPTNTGLTVSPNPARLGQAVTFFASVSASGNHPSGSVTFYNGTTQLGSSNLNGSGAASFTTAALPVGTHSITARYNGNADFLPSTSAVTNLEVTPNNSYLPLALRNYVSYYEALWENEPNDDYQHANGPLRFQQVYYAYPNDAKDYFSFYLPQADKLHIEMLNHTGSGVQMLLYHQTPVANGEVVRVYNAPYTTDYNGAAGWYYIYVYAASGYNSSHPYTIEVSVPSGTLGKP
ncbi:MAG: Ig-like domain repeat protein [Chloroflexota bacterium]